ncbi:PilZ domain-containing protein [Yoonia litorea]|uniref:PilZ domain-containing protein n=1 Tax=Yoonia litorea TaxID=1123755 RepID=A0A1I6LWW5_9RHOB|nr:PilZ domain-containing protein [Yoonia litorea]SFS07900.1 PilZ domain-containing protein [Yoonia litorea]
MSADMQGNVLMWQKFLIGLFGLSLVWAAPKAVADCAIIDQLDKLHTIQTRLAANPDTGLFATDIRQLRAMTHRLTPSEVQTAVGGSTLAGRGADVRRFLAQTRTMLTGVSLDDPNSVRRYFDSAARRTLGKMETHLRDLRCTDAQISIDSAARTAARSTSQHTTNTDEEDMAEVAENLRNIGAEVIAPRNILILIAVIAAVALGTPLVRRWLVLRRRRAKRHNTYYGTTYRDEKSTFEGRILDINCFGAKLERAKDHMLNVGDSIEITIDDQWTASQVVWSNQHYSGLQFSRAIGLVEVSAIIAASVTSRKRKTAP